LLKKFLSKIGIGAASVNLVLDDSSARVGEEVKGKVYVEGGNVDQKIDAIDVDLVLEARFGERTAQSTIQTVTVARGLHVKSGEKYEFPFLHQLPELPQSSHYVRYTYHTRLDIKEAVDKHDFDEFLVLPRLEVATAQGAFQALGFREKHESGVFNGHYQEFEYRPASGPFVNRIEELNVVYLPEEAGVRLHIELDKRGKGLLGALADSFDLDESHFTLLLTYDTLNDPERTLDQVKKALEAELNNPTPNRCPTLPKFDGKHKGHHGSGLGGAIVGGLAGYGIGEALFDDDDGDLADGGDFGDFSDFGDFE
jgi:sporulation-control protein